MVAKLLFVAWTARGLLQPGPSLGRVSILSVPIDRFESEAMATAVWRDLRQGICPEIPDCVPLHEVLRPIEVVEAEDAVKLVSQANDKTIETVIARGVVEISAGTTDEILAQWFLALREKPRSLEITDDVEAVRCLVDPKRFALKPSQVTVSTKEPQQFLGLCNVVWALDPKNLTDHREALSDDIRIAYPLGVNDGVEDADKLADFVEPRAKIELVPQNGSSPRTISAFQSRLRDRGIWTTVRKAREIKGKPRVPDVVAASYYTVHPIGHVESPLKERAEAPRQSSSDIVASIIFDKKQVTPEMLRDLDGFDKVIILAVAHLNQGWRPTVLPPRGGQKRGLFATRSPHRPNPILLSIVDILDVDSDLLKINVRGLDLLHGTPVIDIKPYLPYADAFPDAKAGWVDDL